jgi:hypothetical protein
MRMRCGDDVVIFERRDWIILLLLASDVEVHGHAMLLCD